MTSTMPDAATLATEFSIVLREWLTPEQLREIDLRNAAESNPSICHSHDLCDPNQAMIDALGRFNVELDIQSDEQRQLVSQAWEIAKAGGFSTVDASTEEEFRDQQTQVLLSRYGSREDVIAWLCWNDPNGIYDDADSEAEGWEPMTLESARAKMREILERETCAC